MGREKDKSLSFSAPCVVRGMLAFVSAVSLVFFVAFMSARAQDRPLSEKERAKFLDAFARLGSESFHEREAAAEEIAALGLRALELLVERKDHPDPHIRETVRRMIKAIRLDIARRRILKMFKETGVDEVVDNPAQVLDLYTSVKEEDRLRALTHLTSRRTHACVPILKEFLEDPSDRVVDAAISALREIVKGKDAGIAARILRVVRRTRPEDELINQRIKGFLRFADFRDDDLVSAFSAAKTLREKKVRELVLARMVLEPQENHVFAFISMLAARSRFLRRFCAGGIEVVVRELLQAKRRELFSFEAPDRKRLATLLAGALRSKDPVVVRVVTGAIGRAGLPAAVERLVALLGSPDVVTVRRAAFSLGLMEAGKAVPALVGLLKEGTYEVLPEAADALGRIGDPASFAPLVELLKKKDVPFRELLLAAVTKVDLKRSMGVLVSLLSDDKVAVRALAVDRLVRAMREFPALRAARTRALMRAVREGPQRAKVACARVLGEVGDTSVLPALKRLSGSKNPGVRSAVFLPIAMIAQENARELLLRNVKHANYQVRVRAAEALGYLGDWSHFVHVRLIALEVKGDSLLDALRKIAWSTGLNMVIDSAAVRMSSFDTTVVDTALKGKTIREAFEVFKERFDVAWHAADYALFVTVGCRKDVLEKFKLTGAGVGCSEADLDVEKKLSRRVTCSCVFEKMEKFFESLRSKTGVTFKLDRSVEKRLVESLRFVDITVSDIPLSSLLRLVLAPRGLWARITGGAVVISADRR